MTWRAIGTMVERVVAAHSILTGSMVYVASESTNSATASTIATSP